MKQLPKIWSIIGIALLLATSSWAQSNNGNASTSTSPGSTSNGQARRPNILFIIMDDVGIDQLPVFGYGGIDPPITPNIDAIALAGVRFRNVWAMPECSPSRAVFFEGRYPLRTNVFSAILGDDLANSQVSPFEATTPTLLKTRGYNSGEFGKFHLGEPTLNPYNDGLVHSLGWDYFDGFLQGAPPPIDTTAGGIGTISPETGNGPYTCGFVPNKIDGGADAGSCRFVDNPCQDLSVTAAHPTPGLYCLEQGGIFVPEKTCQQAPPDGLSFNVRNGYYVWPRVINHPDGQVDKFPYTRGFVGEATLNSAVSWINSAKNANKNWMATVAFPQIHTPYQQVPESLLPAGSLPLGHLNCTGNNLANLAAYHLLSNQMVESMDTEIGRLLVQTGLASYNPDGSLNYQPQNTDTMVVLVGDNGTYAFGVKLPFNPSRAKGFVYQTGVWVPLIIAGPLVTSPNRAVESMVNIADLYQLFGEIAGIDVHKVVPASHVVDSVGMLSYLTNPNQSGMRQTNFTQTGRNIHVMAPYPCVLQTLQGAPATCVQLMNTEEICHDEGGDWYGPDPNNPNQATYGSCCDVQAAVKNRTITKYGPSINILPDFQNAIRNDTYKLVQILAPDCTQRPDPHGNFPDITYTEFYQINEASPIPKLDNANAALCSNNPPNTNSCPTTPDQQSSLTPDQQSNFFSLSPQMTQLFKSEVACPGDGNEDKVVNGQDLQFWRKFAELAMGGSSWYDFDLDGVTGSSDLSLIQANLGTKCVSRK
jgi:Sulfatase